MDFTRVDVVAIVVVAVSSVLYWGFGVARLWVTIPVAAAVVAASAARVQKATKENHRS